MIITAKLIKKICKSITKLYEALRWYGYLWPRPTTLNCLDNLANIKFITRGPEALIWSPS